MSSKTVKDQEPVPYQILLDENRTLKDEIQNLRARLREAEELRRAISEEDLDALVLPGPEEELIFTLDSADRAYRVLVETMNEGTATLAFDCTILYCNRRFAELLRMHLHDMTGTSIHRFIAPEDATTFKAFLEHNVGKGEVKLRAAGGKSLPVYLSISSLQAEGSPNAWCLVVTDLTEQKKNEEIVAAERLARSIIEQAAEAIAVCDASGRIIRFSNAMLRLCGRDPTFWRFEDLIDLRFSEGANAGESILPVSSALKGSTTPGAEATFEPKNHQKFHLLLNSAPLKNDDGEIIGCVVTLTDITECKQAEEALRESETKYRTFFENSIDAVLLTLPDGTIHAANPEACRIFGMTEEEIIRDITKRKQEEHRISRYNRILEGINRIFGSVVKAETEEKLGNACLSVALEVTGGEIGFVNIVGGDGLMHDIAISEGGWDQCLMYDKAGHRRFPGSFALHGLYGHVVNSGKGFFTNDPPSHPDSIGLPEGHPPITSFLGVPLVLYGQTVGILGVANREGGYSPEQVEDLEAIAPAVIQALQRKRAEQERKRAEEALHQAYEELHTQSEDLEVQSEELRKANEALSESEKRYRLIVETANEGIWVIDSVGRTLFINQQMAAMLAISTESMQSKSAFNFMFEEDRAAGAEIMRQNLETPGRNIEFRYRRMDGLELWASINYNLIYDKNDRVIALQGMFTDITERKRNEEILRETRNYLEKLLDYANAPIIVWDPSFKITKFNHAFERLTGLKADEVVGKPFDILFPDKNRGESLRLIKNTLLGERWEVVEIPILHANGSVRTVLWNSANIHDSDNAKVVATIAQGQDITERKRAEEALYKANETLEEKVTERTAELEEAYNSLLENELRLNEAQRIAQLGNWDWDLLIDKFYWSNEIYRIFRLDPLELVPTYNEFLSYVDPDARDHVNNTIKEAVLNGKAYEIDYKVISPDGEKRIVHAQGEAVFNEKGIPIRMRGTLQDITERKRMEAVLESVARLPQENPNPMMRLNQGRIINYANPAAQVLLADWGSAIDLEAPAEITELAVTALGDGVRCKLECIYADHRYLINLAPFPQTGYVNLYAIDITEQKKAEEKVRIFANIVESSNDAIITKSLDGIIASWNKGAEQIYGYSAQEILGKNASVLEPDNIKGEIKQLIEKIKQGEKVQHYETLRLKKDGRTINVSITLSSVFDASGKLVAISSIVRDITERKKAEEAIRLSNIYNRSLIEASLDPLVTIGHDGEITDVNKATELITGYSRNELIGTDFCDYFTEPEKAREGYQQVFREGTALDYPLDIRNRNGHTTPVLYNASVYRDEDGEVVGIFAAARDITDRKKAEEALEKMDKIRIKEIHHRIKNNLQVISSLLDLQAEKFEDENIIEAFREGQNRVISMSLLHEELYKGKGNDTLDFSAYLKKLAGNLFKTYNLYSKNICLSMNLEEDAFLDMDIAVPLGIIVNELISNSLKHAFTENRKGEILIKLCRGEKNSEMQNSVFCLMISDDGKGLPEDMELESVESLGLQLVSTLVDQLDGDIELRREQGTEFRITFNAAEKSVFQV